MSDIRIYVACLAAYNAGTLHGRWIDATLGVDYIREEVNAMLRESPQPNVMVACPAGCGKGEVVLGHNSETGATRVGICETCKGRGTVPSSEEWAIHDYEGFEGVKLDEWTPFTQLAELAEALEKHGPAYAAYVNLVGLDYATPAGFADHYLGEYQSAEDWAAEWLDECGTLAEVPASLRNYIDYESYARDCGYSGMSFIGTRAPNYGVYVFNC